MMPETTMPNASLSLLLDGIIDYAGLYPPAHLDMDTMVKNWARGLASERAWMLGRVIVPVTRLEEFELAARTLMPQDPDEDPWVISALLTPSEDDPLQKQIDAIEKFNGVHAEPEHGGGAIIDVVEFRGSNASSIDKALDMLPDELFPFVELPSDQDIRGLLAVLVGSDAGAKIRTGGMKPELYPSTDQLAGFIAQCAAADVPFKATAGLHHPLRSHNDAIQAMEFGFLNVFAAALLAHIDQVDADALAPILTQDNVDGIEFGPDELVWGEHRFSLDAIEEARIAFSLSFGSCSFDDPWDDLCTLGLLST